MIFILVQAFNHVSKLAQFRKKSSALTKGKTMQYVPKDGLYIYFRYDASQTVMIISNTGDKTLEPDWNIYQERIKGFSKFKEVVSGSLRPIEGFEINPKESFVFELQR